MSLFGNIDRRLVFVLPIVGVLALIGIGLQSKSCSKSDSTVGTPMTQGMDSELAALATVMHFSLEDLKTNQAGHLAKAQRDRLGWRLVKDCIFTLVFLLALLGTFLAPREAKWLVVSLSVAVFAVYEGFLAFQLGRDLYRSQVISITGRKERSYGGHANSGITVTLAKTDFWFPRFEAPQLRDDGEYILYYLPRTKTVLSIEPR